MIRIDKSQFQHGRTRNIAVEEASGDVVALLTDDATPADDGWLDAIVESFAKGTPVLASRLGSMQELVAPGRTGLLFEPGDASDLHAKLMETFSSAALLLRMRRDCRQEYEARYTAAANIAALTTIYQQAIATRAGQ